MRGMFFNSIKFNRDLSSWDTINVTDMTVMFFGAIQFNQDLSGWCVEKLTDKTNQYNNFAKDSPLANDNQKQPQWGTCPEPSSPSY